MNSTPIDPEKPLAKQDHENFCHLIVAGESPAMAWKKTVGTHAKGIARAKASDLLKRDTIAARIDYLREQANSRVISVQKYRELLSEAFIASAEAKDLYALAKVGTLLGKAIGAEKPAELTLRNGGVSEDYNPPSRIASLTDAELEDLVKRALKEKASGKEDAEEQ